jgi:hypothetical protein
LNLSAYLDFTVTFDLTGTPKVVLHDSSSYPLGVADSARVIWDIQQPDTVYTRGLWSTSSAAGTSFEKALRLNSAQGVQLGRYVVSMHVDHPDYEPTTKTVTFNFAYVKATPVLKESFDVFTPILLYKDVTSYQQANYNLTGSSVAWNTIIGTVGQVSGTSSVFDLKYSGNYYDAYYHITFQKNVSYQHQTDTFLHVLDEFHQTIDTTADTPKTMAQLLLYLVRQKDTLDSWALNPYRYEQIKERYKYAEALYSQIKEMLCTFQTTDLKDKVDEFIRVTHNDQHILYSNTNIAIPAYDFESTCGGSSTPGSGGGWSTHDYDISVPTLVIETGFVGATIKRVELNGIGRRFTISTDVDALPSGDAFLYNPTNGRLKYGTDTDNCIQPSGWVLLFYIPATP